MNTKITVRLGNELRVFQFVLLILFGFTTISYGSMVLRYNTNLSAGTTIAIPLYGSVNVNIDWGDLNSDNFTSDGNHSHTYSSEGIYDVTITGTVQHFGSYSTSGIDKLVSVLSWDNLGITSFDGAFYLASNLVSVPSSIPTQVTNLSYMFGEASSFNSDISTWDVSNVTNMSGLFYDANSFNQNISSWNVSKVTNMYYMFHNCYVFNQNISGWNVGEVTDMRSLFRNASSFNQDLGNWNVSKVARMDAMLINVSLSLDNYNSILNSWSQLTLKNNVVLNATNCFYSGTAVANKQKIINDFNWTITDAGPVPTPIVTTQEANEITSVSATGNGTITHLGTTNPSQYGVCWSTGTNPDINDFKTEEGTVSATGSFSSIMTGLSPNTEYFVRAYATNSSGTSYGNEVSFTTSTTASVPTDSLVSDIALISGDNNCYNAYNQITVAGNETTVTINEGANAEFIAGVSIKFMPGFHAVEGSYVNAHITTDESFCVTAAAPIVYAQSQPIQIKSAPILPANETISEKSILVYPNPNNGAFSIDLNNFDSEVKLMVFNATGQLVFNSSTLNKINPINLTHSQRGIYFVRVINNNEQFTQKIIIQ